MRTDHLGVNMLGLPDFNDLLPATNDDEKDRQPHALPRIDVERASLSDSSHSTEPQSTLVPSPLSASSSGSFKFVIIFHISSSTNNPPEIYDS